MRRYFLDNLRWMCVLLLIPYHTCMIFNNWGESFYIKGDEIDSLSGFILVCSPWFMPLLFVIAGISTRYALEKRTPRQYVKERVFKLLIPLIFGILLLIPVQTYFAEVFHNGYTGGYFAQYILFFTKQTDLTGYTGGFTPAHLWFIIYLFIISMAALPLIILYRKSPYKIRTERISVLKLLPMFLIFLISALVLDIGGKSLGEFFALFMLGYLIISEDPIQKKLEDKRWLLLAALIVLTALNLTAVYVFHASGITYDIFTFFVGWIGILTAIGMGRHYLDINNKVTAYFSGASFPIYFLHQSLLILTAFYVFKLTTSVPLQVFFIILGCFLLTMLVYEIFKRIGVTRFLFGIKKPVKQNARRK